MAESPRPSRDEVGYALVAADKGVAGLVDARRLAAEVRALHAELTELRHRDDLARDAARLWRRDRAAADGQPMLVGRTYQGELWTALNQLAAAYVDAGAPQPAVPDEEDTP